jgi:hypothetical protein
MDVPAYLLSVAGLVITVGALALGAIRVRSRLIPGWSGMPVRLADSVITLALLIWIAELIGAVGMLRPVPLIAACLSVGLALRLTVRPAPPGDGLPPAPSEGPGSRRAAVVIAAILVAHWSIGAVGSLGTGMTGYDTAWYHMPFAAHFAQTGSTLDFALVSPRYLSWFYPANSELLHGVGMTLTHRDVLSPLLNLLWLAGCLGAAWCVGRPYGAGLWTVAAVAVLLDAGVMADQAGEARNDTLALFFLLAAVALIVNGAAVGGERRIQSGPLAVAGLAAGLAAGTKLSFLAPVGALLVGVPAIVASGRRRRAALAFGAPMLAGCAFWYLRNIVLAGNPLPWFRAVGPLRLDGPEQGLGGRPQFSVLHYLGDGRVWRDWFEPGLGHRLGELWPLALAAAAIAVLVCLIRAERSLKLIGFASAVGMAAYLLDGTSAEGPPGMPVGFASSLRHLLPALCLGLVLIPVMPGRRSRCGRIAVALLLAALLVTADLSADPWRPGYVAAAVAACALAVSASMLRRAVGRMVPRPALAAASVAAIGALIAGGWFVQRSYLGDRYMGDDFRSAGLNAAFEWASGQRQQRIATTLALQYPLLGRDLSNRVAFVGHHQEDAGFTAIHRCRPWRAALDAGGYRFVVTTWSHDGRRGRSRCLARDPRARLLIRQDRIVVFLLDGRPRPGIRQSRARRRGNPRGPSSRS